MSQDAFYSPSSDAAPAPKAKTKPTKRVWYADVIRVTATAMVVLIHVASKDFHRVDVDSFHWQLLNAVNGLSRVSVPLFFMVSGIFFLSPKKEVHAQSIFTKNIWRLAKAFIFWSAVYVLYERIGETPEVSPEAVEQTWWEFIRGNFHLWFLYRLAEVYAIVPILRPITKDKRLIYYFLAVSIIVGILTPTYRQFPIRSTDTLIDNGINFDITLGYAGYMVLGYFLHAYGLPKKIRRFIYVLGGLGAAVTIIGTSVLSLQNGQLDNILYEYLTPNVMAASAAVFLFLKQRFADRELKTGTKRMLLKLSQHSFGVYLIHVLIRDLIWRAGWNTTLFTPILSFPLSAVVIALISYALIAVLSRNKWFRNVVS